MIRVFPRKTESSPTDDKAFFGGPRLWKVDEDDRDVKVSVVFTYDKPKAEFLAKQWDTAGYHVSVGGPAYDDRGEEFVPGRYLKKGLVITSRGCNSEDCWFCQVPEREGEIRELEIKNGYNLCDNNILQCSEKHIRAVFAMLNRQKQAVKLTGGLEAAVLEDWHVDLIAGLKPKPEVIYFAYDIPDDLEPLIEAAKKMRAIGLNNQRVGCYVLMGWPKDTIEKAQERLQMCVDLDMMPFAMLYAGQEPLRDPDWRKLQRNHAKPAITRTIHKGEFGRFFNPTAPQ